MVDEAAAAEIEAAAPDVGWSEDDDDDEEDYSDHNVLDVLLNMIIELLLCPHC